ncbi:flavodoxin [Lactiplantibacillus pentosus]
MMRMQNRWIISILITVVTVLAMIIGFGQTRQVQVASNNRTLIIYFSMSGTTKEAAEQIQRDTGADIVRLQRAKAYPKGYDNYARVADRERRRNIHPAIKRNIPNLNRYDTVLIGFPTWWQQPPMVIHSLFDTYNFQGKTIIPFTTSMSTPMKDSMPTMRRLAKADGATIKSGFRYDNNNAQLRRFLQRNGLLQNNN